MDRRCELSVACTGESGVEPSATFCNQASRQKIEHAFWQPSWSAPEQRNPSNRTTSSGLNPLRVEPVLVPDEQTIVTFCETRNLFPQYSIISGMNGKWFRVPASSRVAAISFGPFTSTRSPGLILRLDNLMSALLFPVNGKMNRLNLKVRRVWIGTMRSTVLIVWMA